MSRFRSHLLALLIGGALWAAPEASAASLPTEISTMIAERAAAGLPPEPLELKAREGMAKGVPEGVLASAVRDLADRMQRASDTLGAAALGSDRGALLTASAAALRAGVSTGSLARVATLPEGRRALAVQTLGDLVTMGLPEDRSLVLVERAAAGGTGVGELSSTVAGLLGQGMAPDSVVEWLSTSGKGAAPLAPPAHGAGGSKDKDPQGKGMDKAPGQTKK